MLKRVWVLVLVFCVGVLALLGSFYFTESRTVNVRNNEVRKVVAVVPEQLPPEVEKTKTIKILFFGDLMFDRHIRQVAEKKGNEFIFESLDGILKENDLVVANLEGPVTSQKSISVGSKMGERNNFYFTFDSSLPATLKKHSINLVSLGNNHILNFKSEGLAETRQYLSAAGVDYFGDPEDEAHRVAVRELNGLKIGFVAYNQFEADARAKTLRDIEVARATANVVILYAHWGIEYNKVARENERNLAHEFIDQGVDAVIGSHPHVIQDTEIYKDKKIYYSLGNFVFDQYFSKDTTAGLAVEMTINPETKALSYRDIPLVLEKSGQTRVAK